MTGSLEQTRGHSKVLSRNHKWRVMSLSLLESPVLCLLSCPPVSCPLLPCPLVSFPPLTVCAADCRMLYPPSPPGFSTYLAEQFLHFVLSLLPQKMCTQGLSILGAFWLIIREHTDSNKNTKQGWRPTASGSSSTFPNSTGSLSFLSLFQYV